MVNRAHLRVGTDTANETAINNDPVRTLLFGFRAQFIYISDFWEDSGTGAPIFKLAKTLTLTSFHDCAFSIFIAFST